MSVNPKLRKSLLFLLGAAVALLLLPLLLPFALPFLIGYGTAQLAEPLVSLLQTKAKLPRRLASVLSVGLLLLLLGTGLYFLLRALLNELTDLTRQLPDLLAQLKTPAARLQQWAQQLVSKLPKRTAKALTERLSGLFSGSSYLMQTLSQRLIGLVSGLLSGMPGALISLLTTLLAAFFMSSSLPELKTRLRQKLSGAGREKAAACTARIRQTLGSWFLAQLELAGISCVLLCLGLLLLHVDYWLLLGVTIAIVDALPILGAGIVLIPWALIAFLQADSALGVGLLLLCGIVSVVRSALEPKLVGEKIGMHPLVSLAAFYVGWRLMGALGMLLLPVVVVLIGQLYLLLRQELPAKTEKPRLP